MNIYKELKDRHQKEMDAFPLGAAFSGDQFAEMMQKWGLTVDDTDKICSIGGGCFIRKSDKEAFFNMLKRFKTKRMPPLPQTKPATVLSTICSIMNLQTTNIVLLTNTTKPLTRWVLQKNKLLPISVYYTA